jgi:3-hydroxyisobutyrate dehydrogenase-like beta-hydroxyacid dehydrogenase
MTKTGELVGVIGTGLMGTAITRRLRGAGFNVLGYDVDPAKLAALAALGARAAGSLADVARGCGTVVLCVFNTDQVEKVVADLLAARPAGPPLTVV